MFRIEYANKGNSLVFTKEVQGLVSLKKFHICKKKDMNNKEKNYRNGGVWQSGISKSLAEYVQRPVCFVSVQSSLHENVVFSVCALMDNAA